MMLSVDDGGEDIVEEDLTGSDTSFAARLQVLDGVCPLLDLDLRAGEGDGEDDDLCAWRCLLASSFLRLDGDSDTWNMSVSPTSFTNLNSFPHPFLTPSSWPPCPRSSISATSDLTFEMYMLL